MPPQARRQGRDLRNPLGEPSVRHPTVPPPTGRFGNSLWS
ncbi:hypothetical protein GA0070215_10510 [Micromonospora marina]|uniref:Uncharacterized protein n=1 Tax=Micromonospora marina TaxID=307120 RepID=A0A1C4WH15_9ACTN|nr:hypothetical protein GA0070215_10510 [Micromonospora marina]